MHAPRFIAALVGPLAIVATGCGIKPLHLRDASVDAAPERDGLSPTDVERDERITDEGPADSNAPGPEGGADASAAARPSCVGLEGRSDCAAAMVHVPRSFCIGSDAPPSGVTEVSPALCGISLSAFEIDRYEVSLARFQRFIGPWHTRSAPDEQRVRYPNGLEVAIALPSMGSLQQLDRATPGCVFNGGAVSTARDTLPMNCISRAVAAYFCAWDGGRLPTQAEWEYVARHWGLGPDTGRLYPWGMAPPDCQHAQLDGCPAEMGLLTRPIGAARLGGARDQVFDLVGNVAEWVVDDFAAYDALRATSCYRTNTFDPLCAPSPGGTAQARGGSFATSLSAASVLHRERFDGPSPRVGFRCVRPLS